MVIIASLGAGCGAVTTPVESTVGRSPESTTPANGESVDTTIAEVQEPPVPDAGGEGLPEVPGDTEEVDCDNAEELCDSGEWACDDIADYCDIGPDGGELPEDWDWDR